MGPQREHLRDDHALDRLADAIDVVDREAEVVHQLGERVDVVANGRELVQPGQEHAHQNCSRNRMSLVNISRKSSMPWRVSGKTIGAEAEREPAPLLGVETAVAQHVRMDHAATA